MFDEMSAIEREELIVSLATLILADAKVEVTVIAFFWFLMGRRRTSMLSWRSPATRLLPTGLPCSLPTVVRRISSRSWLLPVGCGLLTCWCIGVGAAAPAAAAASEAAPAAEAKQEEEEEEEEDIDMSGGGLFGDDDDDW